MYRHDHSSDKFSSLAICVKNNIQIKHQHYFPTLNSVNFVITCNKNMVQQNLSFLLVYRKNSSNILQFVNSIEYLLRTHAIDIVLGDLNINYFNSKDIEPLTSLMESLNYVQIVERSTFILGSLLDHVYVKQENKANTHCSVIDVYYSEHDAIRITIPI